VVSLAAFNVGRLLVPAALAVLLLACPLFDGLDGRRRGLTLSALAIVTVAYDVPYARRQVSLALAVVVVALLAGVGWLSAKRSGMARASTSDGRVT
jgi:hypothetical protein